jgi:diacylglycerol kinase (ATP)
MQHKDFFQSLNDAIEGFIYVVKNERNMRVHFLIGFLVLLAGILLGITRVEWILLSMTVCFVWVAEMFNTLIEETMDFIQSAFHPAVRVIKDVSAGIVLISVVNSLVVGFLIFSRYWSRPLEMLTFRIKHTPWHVTFVALLVVIFLVILAKVFSHRGKPLRGGIFSGHAATAFSIWTAVVFVQSNPFVIFATLLLALLVVHGRLRAKIHNFWEVVGGALVGVLVTALFFQIFGK